MSTNFYIRGYRLSRHMDPEIHLGKRADDRFTWAMDPKKIEENIRKHGVTTCMDCGAALSKTQEYPIEDEFGEQWTLDDFLVMVKESKQNKTMIGKWFL